MILRALGVVLLFALMWVFLRLELARIRAKKANPAGPYSIGSGNVAQSECRERVTDPNASCVEGTGLDT